MAEHCRPNLADDAGQGRLDTRPKKAQHPKEFEKDCRKEPGSRGAGSAEFQTGQQQLQRCCLRIEPACTYGHTAVLRKENQEPADRGRRGITRKQLRRH